MKTLPKIVILTLFVCAACVLNAQEFTGHVTDSTGAALPKTTIIAHNVATGVETRTTTTSTGDYTIPYLIPGDLSRFRKFGQRAEWRDCSLTAIKMAEKRSNDVTTPTPDPHSSV